MATKTIKANATDVTLRSYSFASDWATVQAGAPPSILGVVPDGVRIIPAVANLVGAVSWLSGITFDHIYISRPFLTFSLAGLGGYLIRRARLIVQQVDDSGGGYPAPENDSAYLVDASHHIPVTIADWNNLSNTVIAPASGSLVPFVSPKKATFTFNDAGIVYISSCVASGTLKVALRQQYDRVAAPPGTLYEAFLFYNTGKVGYEPYLEIDYLSPFNKAESVSRRRL